jgi:hypothetical protein
VFCPVIAWAVKLDKNQMSTNGGNVAILHHTTIFPTFYLIDTEGKIADIVNEYTGALERKVATLMDKSIKVIIYPVV